MPATDRAGDFFRRAPVDLSARPTSGEIQFRQTPGRVVRPKYPGRRGDLQRDAFCRRVHLMFRKEVVKQAEQHGRNADDQPDEAAARHAFFVAQRAQTLDAAGGEVIH